MTDEPLTPFDENGMVRDLTELGFHPVGTISDTVEFSAMSNGPPMVISEHTVDYRPIPIVIPGAPWLLPPEPAHEPADIVDRIDELVNDQLANYGNRSGYDNNVNQDLCPHCDREWHGLRITARIEQMRSFGHFDESYRYADDDSEVLCEGSEFIGPMKYGPRQELGPGWGFVAGWPFNPRWEVSVGSWMIDLDDYQRRQRRWWRTTLPSDVNFQYEQVLGGASTFAVAPTNGTRTRFNVADVALIQDGHRISLDAQNLMRAMHTGLTIDVLTHSPPNIGSTWEPITAPGVTEHPVRMADD